MMRKLELLSPAANADIAKEAILHGADAVYMGAYSHGARKSAANSIEDIEEVVRFTHQYRAKVYVTVNTLVYEKEIEDVRDLIGNLYRIGVDAVIVQDMGILRMDIPPIELHASTQCDTRSAAKARFLEKAGFSQIVLARELSIKEIKEICESVSVPIECFIHGALCVSYSGRCRASLVKTGRSANRGECSQMCRMAYDLSDASGKIMERNKYLLSLKDFNASGYLEDLVDAGVSSFKIEGRLKDTSYVKNVTAYYRHLLDDIISRHPDKYMRSSSGKSEISFTPDLQKSFNRGFTSYFLEGRNERKMASLFTPKSLGEPISDISMLNNGDGISFINREGEYVGVRVNRIENGKIIGAKPFILPKGCEIRRTFNREWQSALEKETARRYISVDIRIDETGAYISDERGLKAAISMNVEKFKAEKKMHPENIFSKLGNTIYRLRNFENGLNDDTFIPASTLTRLRRELIETLEKVNEATYPYKYRRAEADDFEYITGKLDSSENVANSLAEEFYESHGAETLERAIEVAGNPDKETVVMTTRFCLRRELGMCKKYKSGSQKSVNLREPLYITSGRNRFRLQFDCSSCEMRVIAESPSSTNFLA